MPDLRVPGVAVYVFRRTPAGVEFLQLRRSGASDAYQHSWQPCYGGVEPGESAVMAALRELLEETGLSPRLFFQVESLESFYFRPTDSVTVMPVFAVEVHPDDPVTLNSEHDAHRWVPQHEIQQAFMWRSQREALAVLLGQLHSPGPAMDFLTIPLP